MEYLSSLYYPQLPQVSVQTPAQKQSYTCCHFVLIHQSSGVVLSHSQPHSTVMGNPEQNVMFFHTKNIAQSLFYTPLGEPNYNSCTADSSVHTGFASDLSYSHHYVSLMNLCSNYGEGLVGPSSFSVLVAQTPS